MRPYVLALAPLFVASCTEKEKAPHAPEPPPRATTSAPPAPPSIDPLPVASKVAPSTEPAVPPSAWTWKTHKGDRFTVQFPGEPKHKTLPAEDDRVGYTEASLDVPGGQVSFAAGFSDYPEAEVKKPDAFLDDLVNAPRRGFTDVLHKRAVTLGGHPGRVLILRRRISGPALRVYSRIYLVGRRLYSLIVSTLDEAPIDESVVKKFMESFKLT